MKDPNRKARGRGDGTAGRRDWRVFARSARHLATNPRDPLYPLFDLFLSLAGPVFESHFQTFLLHPDGQALLRERPSLLGALSNHKRLRAMRPGSFGRAMLAYYELGRLDAELFRETSRLPDIARRLGWDEDRIWIAERGRELHDVWHVLAGYGIDVAGEAAVSAFSYGQVPFAPLGVFIGSLAALRPPELGWRRWHAYLRRATERGRRARLLTVVHYEELLPLPLDEVRKHLRVGLPEEWHPEGVVVYPKPGTWLHRRMERYFERDAE